MFIGIATEENAFITFDSKTEFSGFISALKNALSLFRSLDQNEIKKISEDFFDYQKTFKSKSAENFLKQDGDSFIVNINEISFLFGFAETYFAEVAGKQQKEPFYSANQYYKIIGTALKNAKSGS